MAHVDHFHDPPICGEIPHKPHDPSCSGPGLGPMILCGTATDPAISIPPGKVLCRHRLPEPDGPNPPRPEAGPSPPSESPGTTPLPPEGGTPPVGPPSPVGPPPQVVPQGPEGGSTPSPEPVPCSEVHCTGSCAIVEMKATNPVFRGVTQHGSRCDYQDALRFISRAIDKAVERHTWREDDPACRRADCCKCDPTGPRVKVWSGTIREVVEYTVPLGPCTYTYTIDLELTKYRTSGECVPRGARGTGGSG